MAIRDLLIGLDNDLIADPFTDVSDNVPIEDAEIYCTVCDATRTGPITDATNASPIVVEANQHGLQTGDLVAVVNVGGNGAARGTFTITKVDDNRFSLDASTGSGAYTQGGRWWKALPTAAAIACPFNGQGYLGVLLGSVGLIEAAKYMLVFYALGDYRDRWNQVEQAVARLNQQN